MALLCKIKASFRDKGTGLISADDIDEGSVNHKPQEVGEEQGPANIEDCDLMDLIIMSHSEKSIVSLEKNYIIQKVSKEEPIVEVPHIYFNLEDRRWELEDFTHIW